MQRRGKNNRNEKVKKSRLEPGTDPASELPYEKDEEKKWEKIDMSSNKKNILPVCASENTKNKFM